MGSARAPDIEQMVQRLNSIDHQLQAHTQQMSITAEQISLLDSANTQEIKDRAELDERMQSGGKNIAERIQHMCNTYDRKIAELENTLNQVVAGMHTVNAGVKQVQEEF